MNLVILDDEDEVKPVVKRKSLRTPDYLAFFKGNPKVPEIPKHVEEPEVIVIPDSPSSSDFGLFN